MKIPSHATYNPTDTPDTRPGPYYVTATDAGRFVTLAGPFKTHAQALDVVDRAREAAIEYDPKAHFYAFGTMRSEGNGIGDGRFNDALKLDRRDGLYWPAQDPIGEVMVPAVANGGNEV